MSNKLSVWSLGTSPIYENLRGSIDLAANQGVTNALSAYAQPVSSPSVGTFRMVPDDGNGNYGPDGKQYGAMSPEEIAAEYGNLGVAKEVFEDPFGKKDPKSWGTIGAIQLAGAFGAPVNALRTLGYGVTQLQQSGLNDAFAAMSPENRARSIMSMTPAQNRAFNVYGPGWDYLDSTGGGPGAVSGPGAYAMDFTGPYGDPTSSVGYVEPGARSTSDNGGDGGYGSMTDDNNSAGNDYGGYGWA